jgi:hypothetical protein
MTTTLETRPAAPQEARAATPAAPQATTPPAARRVAPGLTVLAAPADAIGLAGRLLRPSPALALVRGVPDPVLVAGASAGVVLALSERERQRLEAQREEALERALEAAMAAGFDVHAIEAIPLDRLRARMRRLAEADVSCVAVAPTSARQVRRLARAARAPVLTLPEDAAPAAGPVILDADHAGLVAPAAARALAASHAVAVAAFDPMDGATVARSAAHPLLVPRLHDLAVRVEREAVREAEGRAERAAAIVEEHGLRVLPAVSPHRDATLRAAEERDGVLVVAEAGGWRSARLLRAALRGRRPLLFVPDLRGAR